MNFLERRGYRSIPQSMPLGCEGGLRQILIRGEMGEREDAYADFRAKRGKPTPGDFRRVIEADLFEATLSARLQDNPSTRKRMEKDLAPLLEEWRDLMIQFPELQETEALSKGD